MATIVTRAGKGSPLTHNEVDANFNNLNGDKLEASNNLSDLDDAATAVANLGITASASELNILDGATVTTAEINQLDADSTGALKVPTGTVAERPTPAQGQIRFNSDDTTFEGYDGTAWGALGGDFSAVAEDIIPDADSTRDLGSASIAWALAYIDAIEPVGTDTTIKRVGGTNTTPIVEGIAKAWVNFNGTGTIAARDSLNVSSLTDNGTGDYTVNLTNAFGAADYAIAVSGKNGTTVRAIYSSGGPTQVDPTTSAFEISIYNEASVGYLDASHVFATCHGDLA